MVAILFALTMSSTLQESPLRDRDEFIKALDTVSDGMTEAKVRRILGPPDDVSRPTDIRPEGTDDGTYWSYGTNGHLTFATLGRVRFEDGRVYKNWRPTSGPFVQYVPELQVRSTMRALWPSKTSNIDRYDPLWIIRSANALRTLGKDGAVCVMEELYRCGTDEMWSGEELFWLMRALFETPEPSGFWRVPGIGQCTPRPPQGEEHQASPLFPVALVQGVPFKLTGGALLAGLAERPTDEIEWLKKHGKLRQDPLSPPNDPFLAYRRLLESHQWPDANSTFNEVKRRLQLNVLDLIRTVYRPSDLGQPYFNPTDEEFEAYHREFLQIGARWSEHFQMYVRRDGTADPLCAISYPSFRWKAGTLSGTEYYLVFCRDSADKLKLDYQGTFKAKKQSAVSLRIWDAKTGALISASGIAPGISQGLEVNSAEEREFLKRTEVGDGSWGMRTRDQLPPGTSIYLEIVSRDGSLKSPVYRP